MVFQTYILEYPEIDLGVGDWHQSIDDNKNVAKGTIDTISNVIEWDTSAATVQWKKSILSPMDSMEKSVVL